MSRTYLLSLIFMATLPVLLLGYLWVKEQYRQFDEQSQTLRSAYVEGRAQLLRREVFNAIDYMEFQRAQLDQRQRLHLKQQVDNGIAQLDSLLQQSPHKSREDLLIRARELLAPIRFGGGHDHYFIYTSDGTAVLMPAYPRDQGRNISERTDPSGLRYIARMTQLARDKGDGTVEVWYNKPASGPGSYLTVQYVRHYAPLDIYLGAVGYVDDMVSSAQREVLARFAKTTSDEVMVTIFDDSGALLFDRGAILPAHQPANQVLDDTGQPLWPRIQTALRQDEGDFIRFSWLNPQTNRAIPAISYVRTYPGWHWNVAATFLLDKLEAAIAGQRATLQQRVHERIAYFILIAVGLMVLAGWVARRLALNTQRGLQSFAAFFADASKYSSSIDVGQLPFTEFEQLAVDANRMIEQREQIENALRVSEKSFELALNAAASHLWEMDLRDRSVTMHGSLFQQLGYSAEERTITPEHWLDWLHPDDLFTVQRALGDVALAQGNLSLELRFQDAQGSYRWFNCRGRVVESDANGKPQRALGTATEITERKHMEQELITARIAAEDANHAKSQFLSSISHELRTPLNGVLGYAQILLRDQSTSAEQRHNLRAIESCGQHLLTLINDVLDLAKIESGKIEVQENACNLRQLLESVSIMVRERADSKGLQYRLQIDDQVPADICVDEVKLRQILINLLGNAVKFTDEGDVTLRVQPHMAATRLLFEVCDTGCGIAREKQQEIFQPFHQVGDAAGGTGLGLPISQRLCEVMGGELAVQSAVGAGSCFSFHLPLKIAALSTTPPAVFAAQQLIDISRSPVTVLVVDDNPVNRQVIAGMLRASGIDLIEAENGQDALDKLRQHPVPLVLMDVRMPVMDGFTATRAIKDDPQLRNTIVIAVSASVFPEVITRMREHGCDDFISKPVRVNELMAKIAGYLQLPLRNIEPPVYNIEGGLIASVPAAVLDKLHMAVAVGDIEAMHLALQPLYDMGPEFIRLARHMTQKLEEFDIEALRDLLDGDRRSGIDTRIMVPDNHE